MNESNLKIKFPYLVDLPVLVIFFARTECLKPVFEQIRKARPSKLYLYQDGPRPGRSDDFLKINECRNIVEDINWECEVYRLYQEENFGCDPSEYIAQKWMFENEEYGIILEDDDIPSVSFFRFCKELLEEYKYDERINMICGMNHLGVYEICPNSYFFTKSGSIWGWATWKRVIDKWDDNYEFMNDKYSLHLLKRSIGKKDYIELINTCIKHKKSGRAHYESINGSNYHLQSSLNIVPKMNMISNIGVGVETTHSVASANLLPRGIRKILFMKTYEIEFPLIHPKFILEDIDYKQKVDRIMANGYPLIRLFRKVESITYRIIFRILESLVKANKRSLLK